ncbi:MAG TPA: histidine kinase [Mucilaginibacter sp.]|jgi:two-component system LytT family sensor kinase|nr:histidine kinase [Mucilaginibacter sp.]
MDYKRTVTTVGRHAVVWLLFVAYEVSYLHLASTADYSIWDYALHYTLNICLFYFNARFFEFIFSRFRYRYLGIGLLLVGELSVYLCLQFLISKLLIYVHIHPKANVFNTEVFFIQSIYRGVYFIGFSIAYWFARIMAKQRKMILELENLRLRQEINSAELEKNLIKAQNAYLRSQLNPHLLFNTLSLIYNSVRKLSDSAAGAILLLSDMMRYSLSDAGVNGKVPLENEIDHLKNLVKINQLRFKERLNISLSAKGAFQGEAIIPLVLLSFVENIYKHGDLSKPDFPARVAITCNNHILEMHCQNLKKTKQRSAGWGIGIENTRTRLTNYYGNNFDLNITDGDEMFRIHLLVAL